MEYNEYHNDYKEKLDNLSNEIIETKKELKNTNVSNYNKEWINKYENLDKINKLDSQIINELVDNIFIDKNSNIIIKFKYEDEFI